MINSYDELPSSYAALKVHYLSNIEILPTNYANTFDSISLFIWLLQEKKAFDVYFFVHVHFNISTFMFMLNDGVYIKV
jgi:hypothetical protein